MKCKTCRYALKAENNRLYCCVHNKYVKPDDKCDEHKDDKYKRERVV